MDADAAGFLPLQKAYAIPKTDPGRAARLAAAAQAACAAPLAMLEHCAQVALLLTAALETASPLLRSDVGCAAALCRAAAEAAAMNVFVNTGLLAPADRVETETRAEHLRATAVQSCAQTVDAVFAALRGEG
ncbi:MAG: cyclodeaminase/cyclohydrolase family protein [Oscillospiraceae bacterium]